MKKLIDTLFKMPGYVPQAPVKKQQIPDPPKGMPEINFVMEILKQRTHQHKIETLFESSNFSINYCTDCAGNGVVVHTKFVVRDDLKIILENIDGVDEINTEKYAMAVSIPKMFSKKEVAAKVADSISRYLGIEVPQSK